MTKLHKSRWYDIGSDANWIDYGGKWARHIEGTRYHVIRFDNLGPLLRKSANFYSCDLSEVDTTNEQLDSALKYNGWEETSWDGDPESNPARLPLCQVEALSSYGAAAPLWQGADRSAHRLLAVVKRESRRLQRDSVAYEAAMDRPVNAIGSTAREYAAGDILFGVLRGVEAGDPKAELMLKMGVR